MGVQNQYWYFRFHDRWLEEEPIQILRCMDSGYRTIYLYERLICLSLKRDGQVMLTDNTSYTIDQLAMVIGIEPNTLRIDLERLQSVGLIECLNNGIIFMIDIQSMIGKSSTEADRKRDYRKRMELAKNSCCNKSTDKCPDESIDTSPICKSNSQSDIQSDIQSESEDRKPYGTLSNVYLTENEYNQLSYGIGDNFLRRLNYLSHLIDEGKISPKANHFEQIIAIARGKGDKYDATAWERSKSGTENERDVFADWLRDHPEFGADL